MLIPSPGSILQVGRGLDAVSQGWSWSDFDAILVVLEVGMLGVGSVRLVGEVLWEGLW